MSQTNYKPDPSAPEVTQALGNHNDYKKSALVPPHGSPVLKEKLLTGAFFRKYLYTTNLDR